MFQHPVKSLHEGEIQVSWLFSQLFVYGVNENISNSELSEAFSKWVFLCSNGVCQGWFHCVTEWYFRYGTVVDTYNTGKGYAFVTFDNKEDAATVKTWISLFVWQGRSIFFICDSVKSLGNSFCQT